MTASITRSSTWKSGVAPAADRSYMQQRADGAPAIALSRMNFGSYPGVNRKSRIESRFYGNGELIAEAQRAIGGGGARPGAGGRRGGGSGRTGPPRRGGGAGACRPTR